MAVERLVAKVPVAMCRNDETHQIAVVHSLRVFLKSRIFSFQAQLIVCSFKPIMDDEKTSDLIVNDIQRSFQLPYDAYAKGDPCVFPFIAQFMPRSSLKPYDMAEQRRCMPLRIGVIVERQLGDRQFVVSASNAANSFDVALQVYDHICERLVKHDNLIQEDTDVEPNIKKIENCNQVSFSNEFVR